MTSINGGHNESATEVFSALVGQAVADVLKRHLAGEISHERRRLLRNDLLSAVGSHLDWPCVHEEVAVYGLTTRCTSCGVEVAEAQDHPRDGES